MRRSSRGRSEIPGVNLSLWVLYSDDFQKLSPTICLGEKPIQDPVSPAGLG
jgi:hypothetical protein